MWLSIIEQALAISDREAIADAIRDENADLVFTGLQYDDASYGQTGVILAELLGIHTARLSRGRSHSLGDTCG